MKKHILILYGLIAQIFWYVGFSYINNFIDFFNWSHQTKIFFMILLIINSVYFLFEYKKQTRNTNKKTDISLSIYLYNKLYEVEENHSYEVATETVKCWIDEHQELIKPTE